MDSEFKCSEFKPRLYFYALILYLILISPEELRRIMTKISGARKDALTEKN